MSIAVPDRPAPVPRLWTPRLVATLALFVLSATFFCAIVGYALVRQADERQGLERRAALLGAIEDIRNAGAELRGPRPAPHPQYRTHRGPQGPALRVRAGGERPRDPVGARPQRPHHRLVLLGAGPLDEQCAEPAPAAAGADRGFPGRLCRHRALAGAARGARSRHQRTAGLDAGARGHAHRPAQSPQDDRADRRRAGRPRAWRGGDAGVPRSRRPEGHQRRARPPHRRRSLDRACRAHQGHAAGRRVLRPLRRRRVRRGDDCAGHGFRRGRDGGADRRAVAAVLDQRAGGAGRRHGGPVLTRRATRRRATN